ncbi:MAG: uncharacterized protein KVP18_001312 [Porospora cf. gigantea A]|nr:MAG: hypothetical protein KVP18_001312 [Porospora cf. gigantea A]
MAAVRDLNEAKDPSPPTVAGISNLTLKGGSAVGFAPAPTTLNVSDVNNVSDVSRSERLCRWDREQGLQFAGTFSESGFDLVMDQPRKGKSLDYNEKITFQSLPHDDSVPDCRPFYTHVNFNGRSAVLAAYHAGPFSEVHDDTLVVEILDVNGRLAVGKTTISEAKTLGHLVESHNSLLAWPFRYRTRNSCRMSEHSDGGHSKYCRLSSALSSFSETEQLFSQSKHDLEDICRKLSRSIPHCTVKKAYLAGPWATGCSNKYSKIQFVVQVARSVSPELVVEKCITNLANRAQNGNVGAALALPIGKKDTPDGKVLQLVAPYHNRRIDVLFTTQQPEKLMDVPYFLMRSLVVQWKRDTAVDDSASYSNLVLGAQAVVRFLLYANTALNWGLDPCDLCMLGCGKVLAVMRAVSHSRNPSLSSDNLVLPEAVKAFRTCSYYEMTGVLFQDLLNSLYNMAVNPDFTFKFESAYVLQYKQKDPSDKLAMSTIQNAKDITDVRPETDRLIIGHQTPDGFYVRIWAAPSTSKLIGNCSERVSVRQYADELHQTTPATYATTIKFSPKFVRDVTKWHDSLNEDQGKTFSAKEQPVSQVICRGFDASGMRINA